MSTYKIKPGWVSALPYWTSDHIGINNYTNLNNGLEVELDTLNPQLNQFLDLIVIEIPTESNTKSEIQLYLDSKGITYTAKNTKPELLALT
tara:strand:- start:29 stop:301 length:273 start_codon:yes stop_codon:yes gene_type:complete